MVVCYDGLWKILKERHMSKAELQDKAELGAEILEKMERGEKIHILTMYRICKALNCFIEDMMEVVSL